MIFILLTLIIFLVYSMVIKLSGKENRTEPIIHKEKPSDIIQVEVLNGCGVTGLADRFTDYLREKNFDVVNVGNYIYNNINQTLVIDRTGNFANAQKVAEALGVKKSNVIQQLNNNYFLDVTIILGRDYYKLKPLK